MIVAFVILKAGVQEAEEPKKEVSAHGGKVESPIAYPDRVYFVKDVPKTKSSKIMRRVIKAKALGKEAGELSALANPESVENIPRIDKK